MKKTRDYSRDTSSFVDRQGNVVNVREHYDAARKSADVGKAYAFFNCKKSKEKIEEELPKIRSVAKTPLELRLSLTEDASQLGLDSDLLEIAKEAKKENIKYAMKATYPNATNEQTANELAQILNQAYQSPLYDKSEQYRGAVVYEKDGEYLFRE